MRATVTLKVRLDQRCQLTVVKGTVETGKKVLMEGKKYWCLGHQTKVSHHKEFHINVHNRYIVTCHFASAVAKMSHLKLIVSVLSVSLALVLCNQPRNVSSIISLHIEADNGLEDKDTQFNPDPPAPSFVGIYVYSLYFCRVQTIKVYKNCPVLNIKNCTDFKDVVLTY